MTHTETTALAASVTAALVGAVSFEGQTLQVRHCQDMVRFDVTSGAWRGASVSIVVVGRHERTAAMVAMILPPVRQMQYPDALANVARAAVLAMAERLA